MIDITSGAVRNKKRKVIQSDSEDEDESISQGKRRRSGDGKSLPTGTKGKGHSHNEGPSDAVFETWSRGDDNMEPSTKMNAMIDLLKEWEATGDKTIIYSQCRFLLILLKSISLIITSIGTSMLDLIEKIFSRHGIRSLRFDGKMDRASRDSTLATFKQIGGPKVILISTKCGSVGLNLVSANRIIK